MKDLCSDGRRVDITFRFVYCKHQKHMDSIKKAIRRLAKRGVITLAVECVKSSQRNMDQSKVILAIHPLRNMLLFRRHFVDSISIFISTFPK